MNIPQEIMAKRKALKESQTEFGKRFGVSYASVGAWENGESRAPYEVIYFCHKCTPSDISPDKKYKISFEEI